MLARFAFAEIELGMLAALPMHQNPQRRRLHIDDDLFNDRADDPLGLAPFSWRGSVLGQCN